MVVREFLFDGFDDIFPLFLEEIVLFETRSDLSLVLFVVRRDLRLPLLVNLNFESALPRPLFPQVLIQLIYILVYQILPFSLNLFGIVGFLIAKPLTALLAGALKQTRDLLLGYHQILVQTLLAVWVFWRLAARFLQIVILSIFLLFNWYRCLISGIHDRHLRSDPLSRS